MKSWWGRCSLASKQKQKSEKQKEEKEATSSQTDEKEKSHNETQAKTNTKTNPTQIGERCFESHQRLGRRGMSFLCRNSPIDL